MATGRFHRRLRAYNSSIRAFSREFHVGTGTDGSKPEEGVSRAEEGASLPPSADPAVVRRGSGASVVTSRQGRAATAATRGQGPSTVDHSGLGGRVTQSGEEAAARMRI
jgi:hypothetical protein